MWILILIFHRQLLQFNLIEPLLFIKNILSMRNKKMKKTEFLFSRNAESGTVDRKTNQ